MKTLLSLSILLFAAAFQSVHAETLQVSGGLAGSGLKRSAEVLLSRLALNPPFHAIHVEDVGEAVADALDFQSARDYVSVHGYLEKCAMPDASLLPDFKTRLATYIASFQVEEARQAWYVQSELIERQRLQAARCSVALDSDGECWMRVEQRADGYLMTVDDQSCPVLRRLAQPEPPPAIHQVGSRVGEF